VAAATSYQPQPTTTPGSGLAFGILNQKHPSYRGDLWRDLGLLYRGGFDIAACAKHFLPQLMGEPADAYTNRLKSCSYINYLGQIIDYFAASLFVEPLQVTSAADADDDTTAGTEVDAGYYGQFSDDADLHGTPVSQFVRELFTAAILKRCAYVGIDFPITDDVASSFAEEEKSGATRAYLVPIATEEIIDWAFEDDETQLIEASPDLYESQCVRGYQFVILRRVVNVRGSPEEKRGLACIEFKIWRKNEDGTVTWEVYRTKPYDPKQSPDEDTAFRADDLIERVIEPQPTSFSRIPIVELEIPDGLWVGNKIGPLAIEHWRRRSMLVSSENRSLLAIGFVKLGPQVSAPGGAVLSDVAQDQQRGSATTVHAAANSKGFLTLAAGDDIGYAEPGGAAWKIADDQLENLIREMHRTAHQMAMSVNNNSSALVRSGVSKQEDRLATSVIMSAYADFVRDFALRLYKTISEARKENVVWTVHGLDDYERPDRMQIFNEAAQEDAIQIPSPTYKKLRKYEQAMAMLMVRPSPKTRLVIKKEVEEGVEAELEMTAALKEAGLADPNAPVGGGAQPFANLPGVPGEPSAISNIPKKSPAGG
jgi:hypothetical protein